MKVLLKEINKSFLLEKYNFNNKIKKNANLQQKYLNN